MSLSEKTRNLLLAPFAISPIVQRFSLPGIIGFLLFGVGVWQNTGWLHVAGIVLAAPILWVYVVLMPVYFPYLLFDGIRRSLSQGPVTTCERVQHASQGCASKLGDDRSPSLLRA